MVDRTARARNRGRTPRPVRLERLGIVVATIFLGVLLGGFIAYEFGKGLRPGPVRTIEQVGRVELLRLPEKARRLSDIRTFIIQMDGADDYGRIFVNNYLYFNNENPAQLFYSANGEKQHRDAYTKYDIDRNEFLVGKRDARVLLRTGLNYVVFELENSILGTCVSGIDILVNGQELETFPRSIPDGLDVEPEVTNKALLTQFKKAERKDINVDLTDQERSKYSVSEKSELLVSSLDNVVCSRRIFEFELE